MESDFEDVIDRVAQQVRDIGYENAELEELPAPSPSEGGAEQEESSEEEQERRIILVNAEVGPDFILIAEENTRYVEVRSSYALWSEIAEALDESKAKELVSDELQENVPDDHPIRSILPPDFIEESGEELQQPLAAFKILQQADSEVRKEIVYQLSEIFTSAEVKHIVDSPGETGAPHGFQVYYKIFPYEEEFSIRELNEAIEQVRMASHRASLFLRYAFNLGVDINKETAGEIDGSLNPPQNNLDPSSVPGNALENDTGSGE